MYRGISSSFPKALDIAKEENSTPDLRGKAMFNSLAKEEEGHLALLEEELQWLTNSRKYFTLHGFSISGH